MSESYSVESIFNDVFYTSEIHNRNFTRRTIQSEFLDDPMSYFDSLGFKIITNSTYMTLTELKTLKPLVIYPVTLNSGVTVLVYVDVDWDNINPTPYETIDINYRYSGIINDIKRQDVAMNIWQTLGLVLKESYREIMPLKAQELIDGMLDTLDVNEDDPITYEIPYYDEHGFLQGTKTYLTNGMAKAMYDYVYEQTFVERQNPFVLNVKGTNGQYEIENILPFSRTFLRFAIVNLFSSSQFVGKSMNIFNIDEVYETMLFEMGEIIHDYCTICIKYDGTGSSSRPHKITNIDVQLYNIPGNTYNVTDHATASDTASTGLTGGVEYDFGFSYNNDGTLLRTNLMRINNFTNHNMIVSAQPNGINTNNNHNSLMVYDFTSSDFGWKCFPSCRYTESELLKIFTTVKDPDPVFRPWGNDGTTPIFKKPTPEDDPVIDIIPPDLDPVIIIGIPYIIKRYPNIIIPPLPEPELIIGVPPVADETTLKPYGDMVNAWIVKDAVTETDVMGAVNNILWTDGVFDVLTRIFKNNPLDAIISYHNLYIQPVENANYGDEHNVIIGNIDCGGDTSCPKITNPIYDMEIGTIDIFKHFNDYRDYAPYTSIRMYLPFASWVTLPVNEIMGKTLHVNAKVDILTGDMVYNVWVNDGVANEMLIQSINGNCANKLPLSARDMSSILTSGISTVSSLATGNIMGALGSVTGATQNISTGTLTSNYGAISNKTPFIIIDRPCDYSNDDMGELIGHKSNATCTLARMSGYVKVKEMHVDTIACTDEERQQIHTFVTNGVIV
ncbi:MAG: hypothetical protein MJ197_09775 [Bacteroidales bacterium]|nr:hypothetical protein [Bacteroidales bacterium]